MISQSDYQSLCKSLSKKNVALVAVSKIQPEEKILQLYAWGQRDFGENYVQELVAKAQQLPADIQWHFIGHLQRNKVKYIAPFVHLIHSVDSYKLLHEINKHAQNHGRTINVLLQIHIASEETKFGMDEKELYELMTFYEANKSKLPAVRIRGLMGMASFIEDEAVVGAEFARLHNLFLHTQKSWMLMNADFSICSMGMSSDYECAIKEGSNLVRIGSKLFGARP